MKKTKKIGKDDIEKIENAEKRFEKANKKTIFERFTLKENILVFSVFLILLVIANILIQNIGTNSNELNYKSISAKSIIKDSNVVYDREIYWRLDAVLKNVLSADYNENNQNVVQNGDGVYGYYKYSADKYYNFLTSRYKKSISKSEFKKKLSSVISKADSLSRPIEKIYQYNNSTYYLVKIKSDENIYIGIDLLSDVNGYYIFYVE